MKTRNPILRKPCVCITLRRIAQKTTDFYDAALKPAGVSTNQYSLLANIARMEGCGTGELAQQVKLEKSTLVRTLQPLFKNGFIIDKSVGKNRRRRLYLTPAGKEVIKKASPLWSKAQDEILEKLGMSYEQLTELFERVNSAD